MTARKCLEFSCCVSLSMSVEKEGCLNLIIYNRIIVTLLTQDVSYTLKELQKDATGFHSELKNTTSRHVQQLRYTLR